MLKHFLSFLLKMLKDQRGEVGEDIEGDDADDADGVFVSDDDQETDDDDSDDDDQDSDDSDTDDSDQEDGKPDDDLRKQIEELSSQLKARDGEISNLNRGAYGLRQEIKKLKTKDSNEETTFTDAQIIKILDEHKDDPAVQLQVFKQVAKQQTAGVKEDAIDASEIAQNRQHVENFLHKNWPELADEKSEKHGQMQEAKKWMRLDDHPYGDFLSMGANMLLQMPDLIANAKKEGREEALKEKSEASRKGKIKNTKLTGKGKKSSGVVVSDDIKATAKEIGITDPKQVALYAKIMAGASKGQNSMTVEE